MTLAPPTTSVLVPRPVYVQRVWWESHDTASIEFTDRRGGSLAFEPGQFTMLYVPGVGESPLSISGDPREEDRILHTIRKVGAVTNALCALAPGDEIGFRGPYGVGWPMDQVTGRDVVVVAGGIGLAPLRGAVLELFHRRGELASLSVIYGARTPDDLLFENDLHMWRSSFDADTIVTVDQPTGTYRGHVGVVTTRFDQLSIDPSNTLVMTCGPEIMMTVSAREFVNRGVNPDRIYLSMERHMKCGVGLCGRCQYGPEFVCTDGPVERWSVLAPRLKVRDL